MNPTQQHSVSADKREAVRLHLERAPIAETSLGFYFQRIDGWHVLHQGVLWDRFRDKYPSLEILPIILETAPTTSQPFQIEMGSPTLRTAFTNLEKTQLVQVQNGLLLHNWRKTPESPKYRRYDESRVLLQRDWDLFNGYLEERSLKSPVVTRCEMTYFNHLVRDHDWKEFSDFPKIFTPWKGIPTSNSFGSIQGAAIGALYQLESGVVNVVVQPGIRSTDGKEIVQFTLSSVVIPQSSDDAELFKCLDECHDNAQRAFVDFTTEEVRDRWR